MGKNIIIAVLAILLGLPIANMVLAPFRQAEERGQAFQKQYEETVRERRATRKRIEQERQINQERRERLWRLYEEQRIKQ